jgi:Xaa-Pro aminopeptidase
MVFSCEPGVYVPGEGGVRQELNVVVTADGCRVLGA